VAILDCFVNYGILIHFAICNAEVTHRSLEKEEIDAPFVKGKRGSSCKSLRISRTHSPQRGWCPIWAPTSSCEKLTYQQSIAIVK